MVAASLIAARVSPQTKARLRELAHRQQLTESALLKRLLQVVLDSADPAEPSNLSPPEPVPRGARLYVRLRMEDRALLRERATARDMAAATYAAMLIRAHLRSLAPLPREELQALKRSVAELGALGRNLNQIARAANLGDRTAVPGRDHVLAMLKIGEALRDHIKSLIRGNVASWEIGHADEPQR